VKLCTRSSGFCDGLSMALDGVPQNHDGKGLSEAFGWIDEQSPAARIGVIYRRRAGDDGLLLNFCPFCGSRIRFDKMRKAPSKRVKS
jgi:hypothetical protein